MRMTRFQLMVIAGIVSIAILSCGTSDVSEPVIEDPPGLPAAATIELLLDNFLEAYTTMDYEEYEKCLDASYEFVFDPDDVSEEQPNAVWPRLDDLESTQHMFSGEPDSKNRRAQKIAMDFVAADPIDSDEGVSWKKVVLSSFALEVEAIHVDNGETWFLRTRGGYFVDIFVKQIDGDPATWKIVRIVDRPATIAGAGAVTELTTWGSIKSLY